MINTVQLKTSVIIWLYNIKFKEYYDKLRIIFSYSSFLIFFCFRLEIKETHVGDTGNNK